MICKSMMVWGCLAYGLLVRCVSNTLGVQKQHFLHSRNNSFWWRFRHHMGLIEGPLKSLGPSQHSIVLSGFRKVIRSLDRSPFLEQPLWYFTVWYCMRPLAISRCPKMTTIHAELWLSFMRCGYHLCLVVGIDYKLI